MGAPRSIDQILAELEDHINSKGIVIGMVTRVTKDVLKEHIVGSSRDMNFINYFISTLGLITRDVATYEVSIEKIIFSRVLEISS
jgi:hypothetical protein